MDLLLVTKHFAQSDQLATEIKELLTSFIQVELSSMLAIQNVPLDRHVDLKKKKGLFSLGY